jgi:hypothetical protein
MYWAAREGSSRRISRVFAMVVEVVAVLGEDDEGGGAEPVTDCDTLAFPSGALGPVGFGALVRLAFWRRIDIICDFIWAILFDFKIAHEVRETPGGDLRMCCVLLV